MDIRKVKKLIELLDESGIAEIEIIEGEESVRISRNSGKMAPPPQYMMAPPAAPIPAALAAEPPAPVGAVDATSHTGGPGGLGDEGILFSLEGRTPQSLPKPEYNYQVEGIVVVEVTVDLNGNVTTANPGVKGSTTLNEHLMAAAKKAALAAKFDRKPDAPAFQKGTITYNFIKLK